MAEKAARRREAEQLLYVKPGYSIAKKAIMFLAEDLTLKNCCVSGTNMKEVLRCVCRELCIPSGVSTLKKAGLLDRFEDAAVQQCLEDMMAGRRAANPRPRPCHRHVDTDDGPERVDGILL